jgi:predicted AAA+ superfamily ATPase
LKIIHDHFSHVKLIVSGSSTVEIKKRFQESLTGGGYPRVVLEENREKKIDELSEIYNSYLRKDVKDFGAVENIEAFNKLVSLLAFQIGQLVNLEELTLNLRLSRKTVERYVFLLENTFAVRFIKPYFSNKRKELSKMPKVYFEDTGLRNIVVKNFQSLSMRADSGSLFKNAVWGSLEKSLKILEEIKFWRTQAGAEVDLIIEGKQPLPVEIKYRSFKQPRITLGLKNFIRNYTPSEARVVTRDFSGKINFEGTEVNFLPGFCL